MAIQTESSALSAADAGRVRRTTAGDKTACREIVNPNANRRFALASSPLGNLGDAARASLHFSPGLPVGNGNVKGRAELRRET